jgi:hypothetical protein
VVAVCRRTARLLRCDRMAGDEGRAVGRGPVMATD